MLFHCYYVIVLLSDQNEFFTVILYIDFVIIKYLFLL